MKSRILEAVIRVCRGERETQGSGSRYGHKGNDL